MYKDLAKRCNEREFYELELYRSSQLGGVFSVAIDEHFTLLYGNDKYYNLHGLEWPHFRPVGQIVG